MSASDIAARTVATAIDAALLLGLAAGLELARVRLGRRLAGAAAAPWRQPWRDLVRLGRKRRIRPEFASPLHGIWPLAALAATLALTLLVPGFAAGQITARHATVPLIVGLLAIGRAARVLAALDAGAGGQGHAAARACLAGLRADAAWLLGFAALGLAGAGGPLGMAGAPPVAIAFLAVAGVLLARGAAVSVPGEDVPGDYAGPERAVFLIEAAIRRAVVLVILIDLAAPAWLADAVSPLSWPGGIAALAVKFGAAALLAGTVAWLVPAGAPAIGLGAALGAVVLSLMRPLPPATLAVGAGLVLVAGGLAWLWRRRAAIEAAVLVQGGVVLVGLGLGAVRGGWIVLAGLVLARLAAALAGRGWLGLCCLVALAGLPPFGLFTGDFMIVGTALRLSPAIGVALLAGLAVLAWRLAGTALPAGAAAPIGRGRVASAVFLLVALVVLAVAPMPGFAS